MAIHQLVKDSEGKSYCLTRPVTFWEACKLGWYLYRYPDRASVLLKPNDSWVSKNFNPVEEHE